MVLYIGAGIFDLGAMRVFGSRGRALPSVVVLLALSFSVGVYLVQPGEAQFIPPCPFYAVTGFYCPGCGTLRALHRFLHGDICGACRCNPLAIILLPIPLYDIVFRSAAAVVGRLVSQINVPSKAGWAILIVTVLYWVLRNIPVYPFKLLAPH